MHRFYYPRLVLIILNFFLFTFLPALCVEEKAADSLDVTLGEQAVDETLCCPEVRGAEFIHRKYQNNPELQFYDRLQARDGSAVREQVFSSSDHSDIVTLRDLKEDEHAEEEELEEAGSTEENYLGTSSSSHYTFTAAETGKTHCTPRCFLQQNNLNPSQQSTATIQIPNVPLLEQVCCWVAGNFNKLWWTWVTAWGVASLVVARFLI